MANPSTPQELAELFKQQASKAGLSLDKQHELLKAILPQAVVLSPLDRIITSNDKMLRVKEIIAKLAVNHINCLIVGETGTGKELIARALHNGKKGKFIGVNCAGIPRDLFESEFFGAIKGAYTGCIQNREGYFEQAKDGTIFLDEIAEIPYDIQGKLLRCIEERLIRKIGSSDEIQINCRIVSATNCLDLHKKPREFRQDLYYRLRGTLITTIPLRERRGDIRLITNHYDKNTKVPVEMIEAWVNDNINFPFEGNIRELRNLIDEYLCLYT